MKFHRTASYAVALCVSIAPSALAQDAAKATNFGVEGGAAFSKPGGKDATDITATYTGFAGGVFVRKGISRNFAIQPEVLYIQKGAKFTDGTIKYGYVQIPLLLELRFPSGSSGLVSPHIYAGPAIAFKAGCSLKESTASSYNSCSDQDVKIKSTDFSAVFGGGVDIGHALIDVRYDLGFTKVDDSSTSPDDVKNRTFYILVGWRFGHR